MLAEVTYSNLRFVDANDKYFALMQMQHIYDILVVQGCDLKCFIKFG